MTARLWSATICLIALLFAGTATTQAQNAAKPTPGEPCCNITSINSNGVVTAKNNQTNQTFQFRVKDRAVLQGLHVGQNVWANFGANAVALAANGEPCCGITSSALKGPAVTATVNPGTPCCDVVPNAALGSHLGQLVVAFPQGADFGISIINVYAADGRTRLQGGTGNQSWQFTPGTYVVEINGVRVPNVQVKAGSDTRVRVGVLQVKAGGNTIADVLDASGRRLDGHMGGFGMGLPPGTYRVQINGQSEAVQVQAGATTTY